MSNVVKKLPPRNWRTRAMQARYETERQADVVSGGCPLCDAPTEQEFTHWRIVSNKYPYDAVAKQHDLLLPRRHAAWADMTEEEYAELQHLKSNVLNETYAMLLEAFPAQRSIPGHFHLHLLVPKVIDQ